MASDRSHGRIRLASQLLRQSAPPVQKTMAPKVDQFGAALNVVIADDDGVKHMIHFTGSVLHGGKGPGLTPCGTRGGMTVVVHYTVKDAEETAVEVDRVGDKGLQTTEGVVVGIDRRGKRITIRYANGQEEAMQLTPTAAAEASADVDAGSGQRGATKVIVYYTGEAGQKVAHYFKKTS